MCIQAPKLLQNAFIFLRKSFLPGETVFSKICINCIVICGCIMITLVFALDSNRWLNGKLTAKRTSAAWKKLEVLINLHCAICNLAQRMGCNKTYLFNARCYNPFCSAILINPLNAKRFLFVWLLLIRFVRCLSMIDLSLFSSLFLYFHWLRFFFFVAYSSFECCYDLGVILYVIGMMSHTYFLLLRFNLLH